MKIYNTLSKSIEIVSNISSQASEFGFYACGPTVYDHAHLGHMRKYTMDDTLVRVLRLAGFPVKHVMNITDVGHLVSDADTGEDKMEKGARQSGKSVWEVAEYFTNYFWRHIDAMQLHRPDVVCAATDHIPQQIAQVQALEARGFTYTIPGDGIYFDTARDPHYGELAGAQHEAQVAGARIGVVDGKRQAADFALWKFSPPDQQRAMEWDSPWGKGFPGWHIECSAMSIHYLGEQFAMHTGGIDHIPVHHANEIAQAENATGKSPFVKYWVHHNFLRIDGKKMSKSLQNFYTLDDVLARNFSPMALKLLLLGAHYRDELNFTWESLAAAQAGYAKLQRRLQTQLDASEWSAWSDVLAVTDVNLSPELSDLWGKFKDNLFNDLKTPQALAIMWQTVKQRDPHTVVVLRAMLDLLGLV